MAELPPGGEPVDEIGAGNKPRHRAMLDSFVRQRNAQRRLPNSRRTGEDQTAAAADQFRPQVGSQGFPGNAALELEVELLQRFEEREPGGPGRAPDAFFSPVIDFGSDQ